METTLVARPRARRKTECRFAAACVLPATAAAVPALRRVAQHAARRWRLPGDTEEASGLIVTELVTNAVSHSGSPDVTLLLCVGDGTLTLRVRDSGAWRPRTAPPVDEGLDSVGVSCGGRGLLLVEAYAASCCVRASAAGTTVTAELLFAAPPDTGRPFLV